MKYTVTISHQRIGDIEVEANDIHEAKRLAFQTAREDPTKLRGCQVDFDLLDATDENGREYDLA